MVTRDSDDRFGGAGLRLGSVIERRKRAEGGYAALARAITAASAAGSSKQPGDRRPGDREPDEANKTRKRNAKPKIPRDVVDRRKLQALAGGDADVVVSIRELRALDTYLEPFGEGLGYRPLFEKPDLIQTLADSRGPVTFLIGSKKEIDGGSFPHWDVLAMADIQRSLSASEVSVQIDIQDVAMYPEFNPSTFAGDEPWAELFHERGPSLVVLGSNRVMPAAEVMLCKMFGGKPFSREPHENDAELPFRFVWNRGLRSVLPSRFYLDPGEITGRDAEAADLIVSGDASGLALSDQVFVDPVTLTGFGDSYGVCVAQRRKHGQVYLLCAGVSGPATLAAARLAKRLRMRLSETKRGERSAVYAAVVSAHMPETYQNANTSLRDLHEEIRVHPRAWLGSTEGT
jgi:hypothetical protein